MRKHHATSQWLMQVCAREIPHYQLKVALAKFAPAMEHRHQYQLSKENMPDELLDIVNNNDLVTRQEMRSTVHQLGLQHRGVHVFLFTSDGKMLVQKRSADRAASPSALDCSVSEHVKAGESYLEAAVRGMKEEMGAERIEVKPLVKFRMNYGPNDNEISMLYEGTVDSVHVKFDPVEIEEIYFYSIDKLQKMVNGGDVKFCRWFVELLNWRAGKPSKMTILQD